MHAKINATPRHDTNPNHSQYCGDGKINFISFEGKIDNCNGD